MILYHFTSFYNLENVGPENILATGLKAFPLDFDGSDIVRQHKGVWLTSDPDYTKTETISSYSEARITVVIPSTDRRLVRWESWLRKHCSAERFEELAKVSEQTSAEIGVDWKDWYVYFGAVPPNRIRAIEYADPEKRTRMRAGL